MERSTDAATLLAAVAADRIPRVRPRERTDRSCACLSPSNGNLAREGLLDPDPMVRIGTLDMLENVPASQIWPLVSPLLTDPSRGVRIRAASLLAGYRSRTSQPPTAKSSRTRRPNLSMLNASTRIVRNCARRSEVFLQNVAVLPMREAEYKAALRLSPQYVPAAINLSDLYRSLGRDGDSEKVLRAAIVAAPQDPGLHYSLGLALVRLKRADEALDELRKATELDAGQARYAYVYAVALHSAGLGNEAMATLKENFVRHPNDRDTLLALIGFSRESGDINSALDYAERLQQIAPDAPGLAGLIQDLRRQAAKPTEK